MIWKIVSDRPIYIQLVENLKTAIISGIYKKGDKIPSVRELAAEAGVNANTMQRALAALEETGLIITQRTNGRTVTEDDKIIEKAKNSLADELISEFFDKMKSLGFSDEDIAKYISDKIM